MAKSENKGINAKSITISKLFKTYNLYIPRYQREYEWTSENIESLFVDIITNVDYYIGNIMIKKYNDEYELIDGQQRCISLFIILCAIYSYNKANGNVIKFDNDLIFRKDGTEKIRIEDRASDLFSKVLRYLLNETNSETIKDTNEYKNYSKINKLLSLNSSKIEDIYIKILNCLLVCIDTTNSSIKPDTMFLNLNVKGVKLTNDTIIRSMIFSELDNVDFDALKNNWYDVFSSLKSNEKDTYLTYYYIYNHGKKGNLTKKNLITNYQDIIKNNPKDIYYDLVSNDSIYRAAYDFVVNNNPSKYIELFQDVSVHFDIIQKLIKMIEELGYSQFNVAIIAILLYSKKSEKKAIKDNFHKIICFIKWVYLYSTYNSLTNRSPSQYANGFIDFAIDLRKNKKSISDSIRNILNTYSCNKISKVKIEGLKRLVVSNNKDLQKSTKVMKFIKALISFLDDDYSVDWNGEHIICDSNLTDSFAHNFANIIPVSIDPFEDKDINAKILEYEKVRASERHIDIFLKNDYYYNGKPRVDWKKYREKRYIDLIVEKYNELMEILLK